MYYIQSVRKISSLEGSYSALEPENHKKLWLFGVGYNSPLGSTLPNWMYPKEKCDARFLKSTLEKFAQVLGSSCSKNTMSHTPHTRDVHMASQVLW